MAHPPAIERATALRRVRFCVMSNPAPVGRRAVEESFRARGRLRRTRRRRTELPAAAGAARRADAHAAPARHGARIPHRALPRRSALRIARAVRELHETVIALAFAIRRQRCRHGDWRDVRIARVVSGNGNRGARLGQTRLKCIAGGGRTIEQPGVARRARSLFAPSSGGANIAAGSTVLGVVLSVRAEAVAHRPGRTLAFPGDALFVERAGVPTSPARGH